MKIWNVLNYVKAQFRHIQRHFWASSLAGLAGGVHSRQSDSDIFVFEKVFFYWNIMVTCDQPKKVASSPKVLLGIFLQLRNLFWRYAKSNRLWVGCGLIPLNIRLQHKIVAQIQNKIESLCQKLQRLQSYIDKSKNHKNCKELAQENFIRLSRFQVVNMSLLLIFKFCHNFSFWVW